MKKNFKIQNGIYINYNEEVFDLHNNYDFKGFHFNTKKDTIILKWELNEGPWIKQSEEMAITLECRDIQNFSVSTENSSSLININEIGYVFPKEEIQEWLLSEENFVDNCHLVLRFEGDNFIRIDAGAINISLNYS
jgi:hypothetical protein